LSTEPTLYSFTYTKPRSFQASDLRPVKDSGFSLRYCVGSSVPSATLVPGFMGAI